MTHCVLLKFKPGTDLDAVEASVRETYEKAGSAAAFSHRPGRFQELCGPGFQCRSHGSCPA